MMMQIAAPELAFRPIALRLSWATVTVVPFDSSTSASRSNRVHGQRDHRGVATASKTAAAKRGGDTSHDGSEDSSAGERSPADLMKTHFVPIAAKSSASAKPATRTSPAIRLVERAAFWELMCAACEFEVESRQRRDDDSQACACQRRGQGPETRNKWKDRTKAPQ